MKIEPSEVTITLTAKEAHDLNMDITILLRAVDADAASNRGNFVCSGMIYRLYDDLYKMGLGE